MRSGRGRHAAAGKGIRGTAAADDDAGGVRAGAGGDGDAAGHSDRDGGRKDRGGDSPTRRRGDSQGDVWRTAAADAEKGLSGGVSPAGSAC